uniref:substrate-binding domain-containing protein n=1 Tax=Pontiella sp. TaxID=2837462 RepID=UPI003568FACF
AAMARPQFSDPNADYQQMPWQDYAIVRFGRSTAYPQAHYVTSAQTKNTVRAFEQIRAKGYQRVGFAGDSSKTKTFHGGASIAQEYVPAEWRIPNLLFGPTDDAPARIANLAAWLKQWKPEAVYTDNADMPDYLKTLGIRVPQDLGLATTSIHDTPIDSGMNQNPEEIGRTAVRNLVSLLNEQEYGIPPIRTEILVEGTWVDGTMLPEKK